VIWSPALTMTQVTVAEPATKITGEVSDEAAACRAERGPRSHTERVIVLEEAEVVIRIFRMCADGLGLASIAKRLHESGAHCPRPQQGRLPGWCPSSVRAVLYRNSYRGVMVYGRTKKRNAWGKWAPTMRPSVEWERIDVPPLRIVDESLWEAAHAQLALRQAEYLRKTGGTSWGRSSARDSKYLLTGFVCCPQCGGPLQVESAGAKKGKRGKYVLVCATFERKGATHCTNRDKIPMAHADVTVLGALANDLLRPEVVYAAMDRAGDRLLARRSGDQEQRARIQQRLCGIESEIQNLTNAIANGAPAGPLVEGIAARNSERHRLHGELAVLDAVPTLTPRDREQLRGELYELMADWRGVLLAQTADARPVVRKLLAEKVRFFPEQRDGVQGWRLDGPKEPCDR
jgi:hypothetical protein